MTHPTNLREALDALRAPFPVGQEQYRIGPTWEANGERWGRPLAFIDARAIFDRLDEAVGPDGWSTRLERLAPGVYSCQLTVHGITKTDVGMAGANEGEAEKSGASDAIKRAAVQFGIGRYLYTLELAPVKLERRGSEWTLPRGWRPNDNSAAAPITPTASTGPFQAGSATPRQLAKIKAEIRRLGWADDRARALMLEVVNKRSRSELSAAEASRYIDALAAVPDARAAGS